ncbi:MAG TPA: TetR family transcriptional regulator [Pseudonocardia sp.]
MDVAGADAAERPLRRRDAVATRRALLAAARRQLAENGFAGTTTRDVAAAAGVNQALVYRYFGSKEKLLAEAAGGDSVDTLQGVISRAPLAELPHVLLDYALDMHAAAGERTSSLATLVSGVDDAGLSVLIRERIESGFVALLTQRLEGPDAVVRAELLAALVTGTILLREKVKTQALAKADRQTLRTWIDVMAAPLLTAPADPTPTHRAPDG